MASQDSTKIPLEIVTPRLIIRTAVQSDAEAYLSYLTNADNFPFQEPEKDLKIDRLRTRIDKFADFTRKGENGWIVILLRDTNELIGNGGYNTFESVDPSEFLSGTTTLPPGEKRMTDLGIGIDHKHWRKGYGLEALEGLIEHARTNLGCELFRTETGDDNQPWRSLMRTAGLGEFEARNKASYDASQEVWVWKFDAGHWNQSVNKLKEDGKWLI
ncbi:acetyltransferase [Colletotrichum graminicola]|uniref:Acetyltransferase n=1 Tax=Colletotrichum graminicola (strain M1.001 / M2 / FGSC 10212) TaxID=645133 RepID=E3QTL1_COLGM|nr:acetyltransferase [Colletotrichum graminicola M1.001]EFQ34286.1 acetyltransferase [Colletotrichum graminicola M1.001]WDK12611.1 acetyltransferase [Colletotrichum graminicola]